MKVKSAKLLWGMPQSHMPCLPYTRQPVADLWDICLWTAERIRKGWKC